MKRILLITAILLLLLFGLRAQETRKTVECEDRWVLTATVDTMPDRWVCDTADTTHWYIKSIDTSVCIKVRRPCSQNIPGCVVHHGWDTICNPARYGSETLDQYSFAILDTTWAPKVQVWLTPDEAAYLRELLRNRLEALDWMEAKWKQADDE